MEQMSGARRSGTPPPPAPIAVSSITAVYRRNLKLEATLESI
jgi:hypothetical protein